MAARAGAVDHAQQNSISLGLAKSLAPLYSPDKNAAGLARTIARVRGELAVFSKISILNPTPEAFNDFAVRDPKTGQQEIPNEMLHVASTRVGGSSGVNIQDANLLKLQVLYGYKLQVPFVNKVITTITRWFTTDPVKLAYLTQGRLPILATSTVRMQSRAWKNGWMQAKKSVDDAVKAAEKPSSALPVASLKRPWASGPTGSGQPLGLTRLPGTGTGSGGTTVLTTGGSGTGSSRTDANKPGDAVAQPEGSGTALSEEKCINDKKWEGGFFGTLKSATRFFQGVVEGVVQQGKDILNTLRNLDGAWEGLKALAKSFIKDPVGTLQLIAENFADELKQDYRRLTECGPTDVGYLLGKHVNPAKLVKLGLRLTRFGGDLDKVRKVKCASFAAGTPVWTPKGAQPIETLPTEGMVLSRSDTEFSDRAQQITKTFGRQAPNYYVLRTEREAYQVTEEHPLWVQGKGWTPVKNIERGDAIATKDGDTLVRAIELRDPYLAGHSRRVAEFSLAVGKQIGCSEEELATLELAANLSQIGKLAIRKDLLNKPARLTAEEIAEMEAHVDHAVEFLQGIDFELPVVETIAQMHERLNGEGYPKGLKGEAISLTGRILGACDVFCARLEPRSYRSGLAPEAVLDILAENETRYDPRVIEALKQVVATVSGEKLIASIAGG